MTIWDDALKKGSKLFSASTYELRLSTRELLTYELIVLYGCCYLKIKIVYEFINENDRK